MSTYISDEFHDSSQESPEDCDFYSEDYDDCISMQKKCKTVEGKSCVFPFKFRGKEIMNCISTPPRRIPLWCPTKLDSSTKIPVRGQWGYCAEQCLTEEFEIGIFLEIKICTIILRKKVQ